MARTRTPQVVRASYSGNHDVIEEVIDERQGIVYCRNGLIYANGTVGMDINDNHFSRQKGGTNDTPDILCGICLGDIFQIMFLGEYSVSAKCTNCGKTAEIYSG